MGQGGNVNVSANLGSATIGNNNTFNATGGDLTITSLRLLSTGSGDTFNSFNETTGGGNVTFSSSINNVYFGNTNVVSAVGGNLAVTGLGVSFGSGGTYSAWVGPANTGNITITGTTGNITSSGGNTFTSTGGEISFNTLLGSITTGTGDKFHTCCSSANEGTGDISLVSNRANVTIGNTNTLEADCGDIIVESAYKTGAKGNVVTGNNDTFDAFNSMGQGGNVHIYANLGSTTVGNNNTFNATGGNLTITSSGPLTTGSGNAFNSFNETSGGGNVTIGSSGNGVTIGDKNVVNAVGGNISVYADGTLGTGTITTGNMDDFSAFAKNLGGTLVAGAGNLSFAGNNNVTLGPNNNFYADYTLSITSTYGTVSTGSGDTFQTCSGDITLCDPINSVIIGADNTYNANGGDIVVTGFSIATGTGDTFNAYQQSSTGGNVTFTAGLGGTTLGSTNTFNAVGGNDTFTSGGTIATGTGDQFNAYYQNGSGGTVIITSVFGNVVFGNTNAVNAVGGNINVTGNGVSFGSGGTYTAWSLPTGTGNITILGTTGNITSSGGNTFTASGGAISLTTLLGSITTGTGDTFHTCCSDPQGNGDISIIALLSNVTIGDNNTLEADCGDVIIKSVGLDGNVATGNNDTFNAYYLMGAGGNIDVSALLGSVTLGNTNTFNATGGNLTITSLGLLKTGSGDTFNSFNQTSGGGNVTFTSSLNNVSFGNTNVVNAVGGNFDVTGLGVSFGTGGTYSVWVGPANTGNITITGTVGNITSSGGNSFTATGGAISLNTLLGSITTGTGDSFHTCCSSNNEGNGDISIVSNRANVTIGNSNTLEADCGDIIIEAAYKTGATGNVVTGNGDTLLPSTPWSGRQYTCICQFRKDNHW